MTKLDVLNQLIDAITASGKSYQEIGKKVIFSYLESRGVPRKNFEEFYSQLEDHYKPKTKSQSTKPSKQENMMVDYTDNSHNDVKVRTPRKSVFGQITKIGG